MYPVFPFSSRPIVVVVVRLFATECFSCFDVFLFMFMGMLLCNKDARRVWHLFFFIRKPKELRFKMTS